MPVVLVDTVCAKPSIRYLAVAVEHVCVDMNASNAGYMIIELIN